MNDPNVFIAIRYDHDRSTWRAEFNRNRTHLAKYFKGRGEAFAWLTDLVTGVERKPGRKTKGGDTTNATSSLQAAL